MKKHSLTLIVLLLLVASLAACAPAAAPTAAPTQPPAPTAAPTQPPAPTAAPTEAPTVAPTQPPAPTAAPTVAPTAAPTKPAAGGPNELMLATTTSTQDSGLLDYLLPMFEEQFGVKVNVVAVGSGQAMKLGEEGNADVLLVHSPAAEKTFMDAKHGVRREDVMYNDFIIIGPEKDPAGIKGMKTAKEAFAKLAETKSTFISRGDDSGTHNKEKAIWKAAAIEPKGDWYVSAGQGMGAVLNMANEQQAYTLSDRATYLARSKEGLDLVILVEGDKALFNPYGVIAVNPDKGAHIKNDLANKFIDWITSVPVQEKIQQFGVKDFGQTLFTPSSKPWQDAKGTSGG